MEGIRMGKNLIRSGLVCVLVMLLPRLGLGLDLSGGALYRNLNISGKVQSKGTEIDIDNDLDIGDDDSVGGFVRLDGKRHHLSATLTSVKYSGSNVITRDIRFRGRTFRANDRVISSLEYELAEFQYHYDLFNFEYIAISPLLKVDLMDGEVKLRNAAGTVDRKYSETLPVPTVGVKANVDLGKYLYVAGQASGIGYGGDRFIEFHATVGVKPCRFSFIEAGYRKRDLDYDDSDNLIDVDEDGLFVGAGLSFTF